MKNQIEIIIRYLTLGSIALFLTVVSAFAAPPANDNFADAAALVLEGTFVSVPLDNSAATKETGEPNHAENAGGRSIWYKFTPNATSVVRMTLQNNTFNSLLGIYKGASIDNLTLIAFNDDCANNCNGASNLDVMLEGGQTYYIAVDGFNDGSSIQTGTAFLAVGLTYPNAGNTPFQDNLVNATYLWNGKRGGIAGTNFNSTVEAGEPVHHTPVAPTKSVWYKWTPPANLSMTFEINENFNSVLAVYSSDVFNPTFAQMTEVVSNTDSNSFYANRSRVTFLAQSNKTYFIVVAGQTGNANDGNFQLKYYPHRLRYSTRRHGYLENAEIGVWRPSTGVWHSYSVGVAPSERQFGMSGDTPVPADFSGDDITDFAVARNENGSKIWYIQRSNQLGTFSAIQWGLATDKAVTGDFDSDGVADIAVIRSTAQGLIWYVRKSSNNQLFAVQFGTAPDKPVLGDFDGDGATDIAVTRETANGKIWYVLKSGYTSSQPAFSQLISIQWGISEDLTVAEDYDGDGKTDFAVFRPSDGFWYILRSSDSQLQAAQFGVSGDKPQPADYNGDGKADYAVFRPLISTWYVARLNGIPAQNFDSIQWGAATDIPVSSLAALSN